jgi:uncharacterized membrane protein
MFIKLLHILSAIWFTSGLLGRWFTLAQAARTPNIQSVSDFLKLSGHFEQKMVIPGWEAVFVLGLITAWLQGWPLLGFLQGANSNWLLVAVLLFLSQIPLIIFVFLPRGRIFGRALDQAIAQGQVTSELSNAFRDKSVYASHVYELVSTLVVIVLMVAKPF